MNLSIPFPVVVIPQNAGLLVSRGKGKHPERIINSYELIYVDSGTLELSEGNHNFTINKGETLLLYPGEIHRGTQIYPPDLRFYWIHFDIKNGPKENPANNHIFVPKHTKIEDPERLIELFRWFLDEQETGILKSLTASLIVMMMLCLLSSEKNTNTKTKNRTHLAEQIHQFILTEFDHDISTNTIAKHFGYNSDYLGRIYKMSYSRTIIEMIHYYRIKEAKRLLINNEQNIDNIAFTCGYHSSTYFRRIFRKQEGIPPFQFRRIYSRIHINTE